MNYEGQICRSPMERAAFMLPVAVGCSYNACTFCTLFKHLNYRELSMEEIEAELLRVKNIGGNPERGAFCCPKSVSKYKKGSVANCNRTLCL